MASPLRTRASERRQSPTGLNRLRDELVADSEPSQNDDDPIAAVGDASSSPVQSKASILQSAPIDPKFGALVSQIERLLGVQVCPPVQSRQVGPADAPMACSAFTICPEPPMVATALCCPTRAVSRSAENRSCVPAESAARERCPAWTASLPHRRKPLGPDGQHPVTRQHRPRRRIRRSLALRAEQQARRNDKAMAERKSDSRSGNSKG